MPVTSQAQSLPIRALALVQALFLVGAVGLGSTLGVLALSPLTGLSPVALAYLAPDRPELFLAVEAAGLAGVGLAFLMGALAFQYSGSEMGLWAEGAFLRFGQGLAIGLLLMAALIGVLFAAGLARISPSPAGASGRVMDFGVLAGLFLLVAAVEEGSVRGPVLPALWRALGFWPAAVLSSLGFMALHLANGGETPLGLANVFLAGFALSWARRRTGSLWLPLGFHAGWDFCQSWLFGVPDSGLVLTGAMVRTRMQGAAWISGGTAGPEGGLLCDLFLVAFAVLVTRLYPRTRRKA